MSYLLIWVNFTVTKMNTSHSYPWLGYLKHSYLIIVMMYALISALLPLTKY